MPLLQFLFLNQGNLYYSKKNQAKNIKKIAAIMSDFDFGFKFYSPLFCIIDVSIYY